MENTCIYCNKPVGMFDAADCGPQEDGECACCGLVVVDEDEE